MFTFTGLTLSSAFMLSSLESLIVAGLTPQCPEQCRACLCHPVLYGALAWPAALLHVSNPNSEWL